MTLALCLNKNEGENFVTVNLSPHNQSFLTHSGKPIFFKKYLSSREKLRNQFQGCRSHNHKIRLGNKKEQVERLDFPVNQPRELDPSQLPEDPSKRALLDEARCYEWKDTQVIVVLNKEGFLLIIFKFQNDKCVSSIVRYRYDSDPDDCVAYKGCNMEGTFSSYEDCMKSCSNQVPLVYELKT